VITFIGIRIWQNYNLLWERDLVATGIEKRTADWNWKTELPFADAALAEAWA
jgi:hypothetical protein